MKIEDWFAARIPPAWGASSVDVAADQDEILVLLDFGERVLDPAAARAFREMTRDDRMAIATAAEEAYGRKVSWGARCAGRVILFTTATVPVMTRLRLSERQVLDTLIDAGVARTRSEALAWCVRLVGENENEWIAGLRAAFKTVEQARQRGPKSRDRTTNEDADG